MTTDNQQPETAADVVTRCPRCGCAWGFEEIEREKCFACGWEDGDDFEDDYDDFEDDDDDIATCCCRYCYCQQRVSVAGETCNDCFAGSHQG